MKMNFFGQLATSFQNIDIPVRFLILQVFLLTLFIAILIL